MAEVQAPPSTPNTPGSPAVTGLWAETVKLQHQIQSNFHTTNELLSRANSLKDRIMRQRADNRAALTTIDQKYGLAPADGSLSSPSRAQFSADRNKLQEQLDQQNVWLHELVEDNGALKENLQEHQATLEIIMTKHRTQAAVVEQEKAALTERFEAELSNERATNASLRDRNVELQEKIEQMAAVMKMAAEAEEHDSREADRYAQQLGAENASLRKMLALYADEFDDEDDVEEDVEEGNDTNQT